MPCAGKTTPKRERGKRSAEAQEARIQRGIRKRLERVQAQAEERYPEFLISGSSSRDRGAPSRLAVAEGEEPARKVTEEKKRKRRSRRQKDQEPEASRGIRLKSVAPETGVRLKSVARSSAVRLRPAPSEIRKRNQKHIEVRKKYQTGAALISRARRAWKTSRFYQRVENKRQLPPFVLRGTVGNSFKETVGPDCSSCDDRANQNRGPAAAFAKKRLERARELSQSYNWQDWTSRGSK